MARNLRSDVKQLRAVMARMQELHDQEKKVLARRMHDELSQQATILSFELSLLGEEMKGNDDVGRKVQELCLITNTLSKSIRDITSALHPKVLDEFGLPAALHVLARGAKTVCSVTAPDELPLPRPTALALFGIADTIVHRIFTPAAPTKLEIALSRQNGDIHLRICGEHPGELAHLTGPEGALDWLCVEERVCSLEGTVKTIPVPGVGTVIACAVPADS